jgi:arylsulfatase A-like enzyme
MEMNRREFGKFAFKTAGGIALSGLASPILGQALGAGKRSFKNVLLIVTDEQRQDCLGCYGNSIVQTPNIDKLAATGVRFNNAFTPTAVCCPARTSIQTGLLAHEHGIVRNPSFETGLIVSKSKPPRNQWTENDRDVAPDIRFFSQSLSKNNWQMAHIGKWHIGMTKKPADYGYQDTVFYPGYGFPFYIGYETHEHYATYLKSHGVDKAELLKTIKDPSGRHSYAGLQKGPQEISEPAYLRSQTVDMIKKFSALDKPFFISCNFWGPHQPFYITEKHYNMYKDVKIEAWANFDCDLSDKPEMIRRYGQYWTTDWLDKKSLAELISKYYGYISLIDEEIGRIIDALKACGQLEDTLIIYTTDHGDSCGSYRMWDKGFGMYDCIWRIPFIVSNPSIKPTVSDSFVSLVDLANTFLEIGGCELANGAEGRSLMPILTGKAKAIRDNHIACQGYGHQFAFMQRMLRTTDAKYIYNPTDKDEFYDLANDPWETRNIIDKISKTQLNSMKELLREDMIRVDDPMANWASYTM